MNMLTAVTPWHILLHALPSGTVTVLQLLVTGAVVMSAAAAVVCCAVLPGGPSAEELQKVRTRKPAPPVIAAVLADGSRVPLWCTFSDQQVCR